MLVGIGPGCRLTLLRPCPNLSSVMWSVSQDTASPAPASLHDQRQANGYSLRRPQGRSRPCLRPHILRQDLGGFARSDGALPLPSGVNIACKSNVQATNRVRESRSAPPGRMLPPRADEQSGGTPGQPCIFSFSRRFRLLGERSSGGRHHSSLPLASKEREGRTHNCALVCNKLRRKRRAHRQP